MMAGLFQRHLQSAVDPDLLHKTRAKRQPVGRITEPFSFVSSPTVFISRLATARR
jgi:hypothetical protein